MVEDEAGNNKVLREISLCKHGCCPKVQVLKGSGVQIVDDDASIYFSQEEWNQLKYLIRRDRV